MPTGYARSSITTNRYKIGLAVIAANLFEISQTVLAQSTPPAVSRVTFADLADLADAADLVALVHIVRVAKLEPERAVGVRPGYARLYVEGQTKALLTGRAPLREAVRYLVDVPIMDSDSWKRRDVFVFATRPRRFSGDLRLVRPNAQLAWSPGLEQRLRPLLRSMVSSRASAEVSGVREVLHVPGNLAGQGRTQIFLKTEDDSAASITVRRRPDSTRTWSVSFSELAAGSEAAPNANTFAWYRLACFLPQTPPVGTNISQTAPARRKALEDYRFVMEQLGTCERRLTQVG